MEARIDLGEFDLSGEHSRGLAFRPARGIVHQIGNDLVGQRRVGDTDFQNRQQRRLNRIDKFQQRIVCLTQVLERFYFQRGKDIFPISPVIGEIQAFDFFGD